MITSFAVSNAIVLPLTGWLSDYFGRVRLFVWSVLLFAFTSFLCGLSTNLAVLVSFRVAQGAVAGSLIPLSQSLMVTHNPPEKQGAAIGFWGTIVIVAPILGPIVGGYLTDVYSWPWIFYINVPIGIFSAVITWLMLSDKESEIVRNPIDWTGLFLLALAVAALQIMLDKGKDLDWFESNFIIALTIISAVSFIYFLIWNKFQKYPIVDFSFFKLPQFHVWNDLHHLGLFALFRKHCDDPLMASNPAKLYSLLGGHCGSAGGHPSHHSVDQCREIYDAGGPAPAHHVKFYSLFSGILLSGGLHNRAQPPTDYVCKVPSRLRAVVFLSPSCAILFGRNPERKICQRKRLVQLCQDFNWRGIRHFPLDTAVVPPGNFPSCAPGRFCHFIPLGDNPVLPLHGKSGGGIQFPCGHLSH